VITQTAIKDTAITNASVEPLKAVTLWATFSKKLLLLCFMADIFLEDKLFF
jgi:hypothetical protein